MAAAALWGYPRAPCPLRIWGVYLMVGPSAMELTPSSWLFPDLLPLRVLESSKAANWYAPQQERFGGAGCRRLYAPNPRRPFPHATASRDWATVTKTRLPSKEYPPPERLRSIRLPSKEYPPPE